MKKNQTKTPSPLRQKINAFYKSITLTFKDVLTTPRGIIAWLIANVLVNIIWEYYLIMWLITQDANYLALAGAVYAAMWLPPPIEPIFVAIATVLIYQFFGKKNLFSNKKKNNDSTKSKAEELKN
jgi:bacteriorhodopsin